MIESTKAIFLSYASQDAEIARHVADALREAGLAVWFDQNELRGGDAWDATIRTRIKECVLFVAFISKNTEARSEGYFRLEWKLAVDRSHLMADDQAFLMPVVIDDTNEAKARVPDRFRERQLTRASDRMTRSSYARSHRSAGAKRLLKFWRGSKRDPGISMCGPNPSPWATQRSVMPIGRSSHWSGLSRRAPRA